MYSGICVFLHLCIPFPPKSPNGVLSCCVAWGEEQSGQQVSVQSQIRSTAKAQRNHTYAQCGRYYKQHHRPLQIPITLTIYRSVCKCAKVIWQMWKCRNVHLEGCIALEAAVLQCNGPTSWRIFGEQSDYKWSWHWYTFKPFFFFNFVLIFDAKILKSKFRSEVTFCFSFACRGSSDAKDAVLFLDHTAL